jgi:hypothetical protein
MTSYIKTYVSGSGASITIKGIIPNKSVSFPAFLTSFSDSMTSNWNEEQVYGRPDPIGTFQNTSRKISLGFDVPAATLAEAQSNLTNINSVKQFMYPAYSSVGGEKTSANALSLAKSPLIRLKFANLIDGVGKKGLLGWINSFSATPVIDMGMFNSNQNLFPKVYNVSLDFTPQHEFDLGYTTEIKTKENDDGTTTESTITKTIDGNFTKFPYDGGS